MRRCRRTRRSASREAIAHGKAIAAAPDEGESEETEAIIDAAEAARIKGGPGAREPPSTDGLPPHPTGKRTYTKSAPGRPTHTTYQKAVMARFYELNKMPDAAEREALGKALGLTPRAVQVWFQNRRQRQKEAKEAAAPRGGGGGRPSSHDQQGTTTTTTWHQMYPEVAGGSASHSIRSPTNGLDQQQAVGIDLSQAFAPAGYKEAFGPTATASYLGPAQPAAADAAAAACKRRVVASHRRCHQPESGSDRRHLLRSLWRRCGEPGSR